MLLPEPARWEAAVPPMAELGASGRELRLRCPSCTGGWLREASAMAEAGSCTRAGSTMVIDFIVGADAQVWPMVAAGTSNDEIQAARGIRPLFDDPEEGHA